MKMNNVWLDLQKNPLPFHDTVCVFSDLIMHQDWQIMLSQEGKVKCTTRNLTTLVFVIPQAYTTKGCTLIQVLPPPNAYTKSYCCLLIHIFIFMEMNLNAYTGVHVHIQVHFHENEYTHEQTTIGFDVRFRSRKYLNTPMPFSCVSQ